MAKISRIKKAESDSYLIVLDCDPNTLSTVCADCHANLAEWSFSDAHKQEPSYILAQEIQDALETFAKEDALAPPGMCVDTPTGGLV